jgi:hypothetical protein
VTKHRPTTRCCRVQAGVQCNRPLHQHGPAGECPGEGRSGTFHVNPTSPNAAATSFSAEEVILMADLFAAMLCLRDTRPFARRPGFKGIVHKTAGLRRTLTARKAARA